jgi:hypothetical protein
VKPNEYTAYFVVENLRYMHDPAAPADQKFVWNNFIESRGDRSVMTLPPDYLWAKLFLNQPEKKMSSPKFVASFNKTLNDSVTNHWYFSYAFWLLDREKVVPADSSNQTEYYILSQTKEKVIQQLRIVQDHFRKIQTEVSSLHKTQDFARAIQTQYEANNCALLKTYQFCVLCMEAASFAVHTMADVTTNQCFFLQHFQNFFAQICSFCFVMEVNAQEERNRIIQKFSSFLQDAAAEYQNSRTQLQIKIADSKAGLNTYLLEKTVFQSGYNPQLRGNGEDPFVQMIQTKNQPVYQSFLSPEVQMKLFNGGVEDAIAFTSSGYLFQRFDINPIQRFPDEYAKFISEQFGIADPFTVPVLFGLGTSKIDTSKKLFPQHELFAFLMAFFKVKQTPSIYPHLESLVNANKEAAKHLLATEWITAELDAFRSSFVNVLLSSGDILQELKTNSPYYHKKFGVSFSAFPPTAAPAATTAATKPVIVDPAVRFVTNAWRAIFPGSSEAAVQPPPAIDKANTALTILKNKPNTPGRQKKIEKIENQVKTIQEKEKQVQQAAAPIAAKDSLAKRVAAVPPETLQIQETADPNSGEKIVRLWLGDEWIHVQTTFLKAYVYYWKTEHDNTVVLHRRLASSNNNYYGQQQQQPFGFYGQHQQQYSGDPVIDQMIARQQQEMYALLADRTRAIHSDIQTSMLTQQTLQSNPAKFNELRNFTLQLEKTIAKWKSANFYHSASSAKPKTSSNFFTSFVSSNKVSPKNVVLYMKNNKKAVPVLNWRNNTVSFVSNFRRSQIPVGKREPMYLGNAEKKGTLHHLKNGQWQFHGMDNNVYQVVTGGSNGDSDDEDKIRFADLLY